MNVSFKQMPPVSPTAAEELQHSLALLTLLHSNELKTVFQAIGEADFTNFNSDTVSKEEAEGLLAFLQVAEVFVPFAANQPVLQSLVPVEVWRAMVNVYQKVKPHRELLEGKRTSSKMPNEYWEAQKNRKHMTVREQMEYQLATKGWPKLENIVGKWPGNETYEEIVEDIRRNK